jgi:dTMP kinase
MYGKFITIEGIEGVGKSTATQFLSAWLTQAGIKHIVTREPGGTPIAEAIRQILLAQHAETMYQDTELLLMFASRAQHLANLIKPALASGTWVLCDRFTDASYAYQGGGRGIVSDRIAVLEQWVQGSLQPDLTILLTAPVSLALARLKGRKPPDRFEEEHEAFFQQVAAAYFARSKQFPGRYRVVDASLALDEVQAQLTQVMQQYLKEAHDGN